MKLRLIFSFFALFIFLQPVCVLAGEAQVISVKADGRAEALAEDGANVKNKATEDALKNAVREAVKAVIKNEGFSADPAAMSEAAAGNYLNYVLNYRIIFEGPVAAPPPPEAAPGTAMPGAPEASAYAISLEASVDAGLVREMLSEATGERKASAAVFTLVALDLPDFAAFDRIKEALARISAVKDVNYISFSRAKAVLELSSTVSRAKLTEELRKELGSGFIVADVSGKVAIKYISGEELR